MVCSSVAFPLNYDVDGEVLDAGSDVVNISTTARRDGEFFVLNGSKDWITSGIQAKAAIVFATSDKQLGHKGISGKDK